jgi:hypothetical protein
MLLFLALSVSGALLQAPVSTDRTLISGRVSEEGTQTVVAGAQVMLMPQLSGPPSAGQLPLRPKMATTDENGRFQFVDLEPGRYRINAQKVGFAPAPGRNGSVSVELDARARVASVNLTLQRGGVIAGRVVDSNGEPAVDARVMALRRGPIIPPGVPPQAAAAVARMADRLMPAGPGAQTNDLGEFRLHSLAPGEYYVQATASPRPRVWSGSTATASTTTVPTYFPGTADPQAAQGVLVASGQTTGDIAIRIVTAAAFEVSGVVTDETGQPVADAMVRVVPQGPGVGFPAMGPFDQTRTDSKGAFSLPNLTNGRYEITAMPPIVIATTPERSGGGSIGGATSWSTFSTGSTGSTGVNSGLSAGITAGGVGGMVTTESRNGTTVQYRGDTGTQAPVVINDASVTGIQLVVRRPAGR